MQCRRDLGYLHVQELNLNKIYCFGQVFKAAKQMAPSIVVIEDVEKVSGRELSTMASITISVLLFSDCCVTTRQLVSSYIPALVLAKPFGGSCLTAGLHF